MEMYSRKEKNALKLAYHYVSRTIDSIRIRIRLKSNTGIRDGRRVKTEAERQAESAKRNYEAQALAVTWQGPRYFR